MTVRSVVYECGCEAKGHLISNKCPIHLEPIISDNYKEVEVLDKINIPELKKDFIEFLKSQHIISDTDRNYVVSLSIDDNYGEFNLDISYKHEEGRGVRNIGS